MEHIDVKNSLGTIRSIRIRLEIEISSIDRCSILSTPMHTILSRLALKQTVPSPFTVTQIANIDLGRFVDAKPFDPFEKVLTENRPTSLILENAKYKLIDKDTCHGDFNKPMGVTGKFRVVGIFRRIDTFR